MTSQTAAIQTPAGTCRTLYGISTLLTMVYQNIDVMPIWNELMARFNDDLTDAHAIMDLSILLQATGQRDKGLEIQAMATDMQKVFTRVYGSGQGLKVAAFVTQGDFMANTPIDFLLEGSDFTLYYVYVDAVMQSLPPIADCDIAFLAIGESQDNAALLSHLTNLLNGWQGAPILNCAPEKIKSLTRDGVYNLMQGAQNVFTAKTVISHRPELLAVVSGSHALDMAFPLIVRPYGTHAGKGMEKITSVTELDAYLAACDASVFYVAPFVDYSEADGLFRKQRIVFIDGKPYASHHAISNHWMVHYLSAQMVENAEHRAEEAHWMAHFDDEFAIKHKVAFEALCERFGLDYFGIDCAELADGRLFLFEADVAMIVHNMDPVDIFPYKKPAMEKLFKAFQNLLHKKAKGG